MNNENYLMTLGEGAYKSKSDVYTDVAYILGLRMPTTLFVYAMWSGNLLWPK